MKKLIFTLSIGFVVYEIMKVWMSIPIFNLTMIPFVFSAIGFAGFIFTTFTLNKVKQFTVKEQQERMEYEKQRKEKEKDDFFRRYDAEVKPMYEKGRTMFAKMMKEGLLKHYQIKDLQKIIDGCLGVHVKYYHNYKFKNDAHQVYVKMKNYNLNEYDWERILTFLDDVQTNPDFKVLEVQ